MLGCKKNRQAHKIKMEIHINKLKTTKLKT